MFLHNPRCSKSRNGLKYLNDKGITPMVVKYMDNPLNSEEIRQILTKLGIKAEDLVRKNEEYYKKEIKGKDFSEIELIEAMATNPKLIERPIVINGNKAVVARPVENIDKII